MREGAYPVGGVGCRGPLVCRPFVHSLSTYPAPLVRYVCITCAGMADPPANENEPPQGVGNGSGFGVWGYCYDPVTVCICCLLLDTVLRLMDGNHDRR